MGVYQRAYFISLEMLNHNLISDLVRMAPSLHRAGTLEPTAIEALARRATSIDLEHSAETGSGISTILLSLLSKDHTVFSVDAGDSISNVRTAPHFNAKNVSFIEGPTQLTLPRYDFQENFDLVLLDGPHGWPFPDLEYYYFYPHIRTGGLLVIDDIQIRTIHNMFDFLRADKMWDLCEVSGNTAFFTRTGAPMVHPLHDGWAEQGYNNPQS